jgi:GAF domain-containing protein
VGDFGESVLRVAILVPDAIRDNLECLIALSMPQESINNMQFYIGNDNKMKNEKGGVPADVFSSGKTCIGHMMKAGDQWICRDCQGKYILPSKPYPLPLYRSFAVVPITNDSTSTLHTTKCLGIIWLDSLNELVFDSKEASMLLTLLASRIEAVLCIINKLP